MSSLISMESKEHDPTSSVALHHVDLLGVSKVNGRRYGSTGTVSTEAYTSSSSSSSSQVSSTSLSNANKNFHHLSLDLSIDNSESGEDCDTLLPGHSRESSYSDISSDHGGGYYDRFARHRQRSRDACYSIENSVFTRNNVKVILSLAIWFISYMIMGVFGGSVAYMHFERSDRDVPDPLPDFGHEVIPVSR